MGNREIVKQYLDKIKAQIAECKDERIVINTKIAILERTMWDLESIYDKITDTPEEVSRG